MHSPRTRRPSHRQASEHWPLQAEVIALARCGAPPDAIADRLDVGRDWVASVLFRYRVDPDAQARIDGMLGDAA